MIVQIIYTFLYGRITLVVERWLMRCMTKIVDMASEI